MNFTQIVHYIMLFSLIAWTFWSQMGQQTVSKHKWIMPLLLIVGLAIFISNFNKIKVMTTLLALVFIINAIIDIFAALVRGRIIPLWVDTENKAITQKGNFAVGVLWGLVFITHYILTLFLQGNISAEYTILNNSFTAAGTWIGMQVQQLVTHSRALKLHQEQHGVFKEDLVF